MNLLDQLIGLPLGSFMLFLYNYVVFKNYGLAIIVFTIIVKTLLLPLSVKSTKSMMRMQELQPEIQDLQRKYKNDREKLNIELMNLYKENDVNPAAGCLPLLIQMPIILSLYWVLSQPLKFLLHKTPADIALLQEKVYRVIHAIPAEQQISPGELAKVDQITIINFFNEKKDLLSEVSNVLKPQELINFDFLGLNLGHVPKLELLGQFNLISSGAVLQYLANVGLVMIPVLAVLGTYISIKFSMYSQKKNNQISNRQQEMNEMQASMQRTMTFMAPAMTAMIAFGVPAGLSFYWTLSSLYSIFQQWFMNKYVLKHKNEVKKVEGGKRA